MTVAWVRKKLGLGPGSSIRFRLDGDKVILEPSTWNLDALQGSMKGAFGPDVDAWLREVRAEWDRGY